MRPPRSLKSPPSRPSKYTSYYITDPKLTTLKKKQPAPAMPRRVVFFTGEIKGESSLHCMMLRWEALCLIIVNKSLSFIGLCFKSSLTMGHEKAGVFDAWN
jgi:hypothetical protein